jgi:dienelactone hydrolase
VFFMGRGLESLSMTLSVSVDGSELASTAFTRTYADPGLSETSFEDRGILFRPDGSEPLPGVLVLGGSDGARHDHAAALLASHGFAALSLAYFGTEGTPSHLHRIELRTFETVLDWLAAQPGIDGDRLAVIGLSRGGELALQLAALYPRLRAVVAGAPSSVRQAGLTSSYTDFTQPAWVLDGEPLPFVPGKNGPREFFSFVTGMIRRRPMAQVDMFRRLLHGDQDVVRRASIEVENIAGRILLVSGVDDQLWPSAEYCELIIKRLRAHGREARRLSYPDAGHFVCFPYGLPSMPPFVRLALGPITMDFGGTPAANAAAARQSWPEILAFLADV